MKVAVALEGLNFFFTIMSIPYRKHWQFISKFLANPDISIDNSSVYYYVSVDEVKKMLIYQFRRDGLLFEKYPD